MGLSPELQPSLGFITAVSTLWGRRTTKRRKQRIARAARIEATKKEPEGVRSPQRNMHPRLPAIDPSHIVRWKQLQERVKKTSRGRLKGLNLSDQKSEGSIGVWWGLDLKSQGWGRLLVLQN